MSASVGLSEFEVVAIEYSNDVELANTVGSSSSEFIPMSDKGIKHHLLFIAELSEPTSCGAHKIFTPLFPAIGINFNDRDFGIDFDINFDCIVNSNHCSGVSFCNSPC